RRVLLAVPDREDLVVAYSPSCRGFPADLAFPPRAHMDRHRAREDAILVVEFVAECCVRIEQGEGRFRNLPGPASDEDDLARAILQPRYKVPRARHWTEFARRPQDLGLRESPQSFGAHPESLLPIDVAVDPRLRHGGNFRLLSAMGGQLGQELVEDQRVL